MPYTERARLYQKIEALRGRPLVVYATSSRRNAAGQIDAEAVPQFAKQLLAIPKNQDHLDIFLASESGDALAAGRMISLLRERFKKIGVLLPYSTGEAATLFTLAADEIFMHPFAALAPITSSLSFEKRNFNRGLQEDEGRWDVAEVRHFFEFVKMEIGEAHERNVEQALKTICAEAGALPLGAALRRARSVLALSEKLLNRHLHDKSRVGMIAAAMNSAFSENCHALGRQEVQELGLPVIPSSEELEDLLWQIWQDVEEEMKCNKPFDALELIFRNSEAAALISPVMQVQWPAHAPAEMAPQIYGNVLPQVKIAPAPSVDYNLLQATLESVRCKSEFRTHGKISAARKPDMSLATGNVRISAGWKFSKSLEAPAKNG